MKSLIAVAVAVVTIIFVLDTGSAIKCFVCNSYHQADCADWFDNVTQHLTECPETNSLCRKIVQEVFYDGEWDVRYVRQCAEMGDVGPREGRDCKERVGTYNVKLRYCHCDNQDGCNSAITHSFNYATPIIMTFLSTAAYSALTKL
ncbi:hypothetical protein SNE40_005784 [Patella caerulea]|uniref:Protein sleepless n=1 Tax=Patella caerulea TaxID=87958 RepID=A0AAN8K4B0_PATCE